MDRKHDTQTRPGKVPIDEQLRREEERKKREEQEHEEKPATPPGVRTK